MLCITMKRGEYFTVGKDTVILFDQLSGERIHLTIHAPREVSILRGEALERQGGQRPTCLSALPPRKKPKYKPAATFLWNSGREQAIRRLEKLAAQLESRGDGETAQSLREQIHQLLPQPWEEEAAAKLISDG